MSACFIDQNCCGTTYQAIISNYYLKIILLSSAGSTQLKSLPHDKTVNLDVSFGYSNHTGHQISATLFIYIELGACLLEDNSFIFLRKFADYPHCEVNVTCFCFIRIHRADGDEFAWWMDNKDSRKVFSLLTQEHRLHMLYRSAFNKKQHIIYAQCFPKKCYIVFNSIEVEFAKSGKSCRKNVTETLNVTVLHFLSPCARLASWAESAWTLKCLTHKTRSEQWGSKSFFAFIIIFYFIYIHRCTKRDICWKSFCFI